MPEEAATRGPARARSSIQLPTAAAEYGVIRTYLDWLVSLPWSKRTEDNLEIAHARKVLDEDHYGLKDIKERILEFLAVRRLRAERSKENAEDKVAKREHRDYVRREREGAILCFVGPPGVGKTSLGASIARAMGRKFIRMSLGGVRDEAEIRGFRRTYIGAMPGRMIQTLRRVESRNPVIMLDEVDKLGRDFRGDPACGAAGSARPGAESPNSAITIWTWRSICPRCCSSPPPTNSTRSLARCATGWRSSSCRGYTEQEKVQIARQLSRPAPDPGKRPAAVARSSSRSEALELLIRDYTREAGVRSLEREIGTRSPQGGHAGRRRRYEDRTRVTPATGAQRAGQAALWLPRRDRASAPIWPGVATGLAVTADWRRCAVRRSNADAGRQAASSTPGSLAR